MVSFVFNDGMGMEKQVRKGAVFIFALFLLVLFALSASAQYEKVNIFRGNVTIGGSNAVNGAIVEAFIGISSSASESYTIGTLNMGIDFNYTLDFVCNSGSTVTLKVWGISATTATCSDLLRNESSNLSVSLLSNGASCSYNNACSSASCCSGTCAASCSSGGGTTSGSSSGGGGGGGGGAALVSETSSPVTISGSSTTGISFTKSGDIAVQTISLVTTAEAAIVGGQVTVRETTVGSETSSAIEVGDVKVYKYLSITKVNIKDSDIQNAKIKFEVPASWINSNGIDPKTVKLNRLVGNVWVPLATAVVSSDSGEYVYEAETPGFSVFAISGEQSTSAFQIIDAIRDFYAGTSKLTPFDIIDMIRKFYA